MGHVNAHRTLPLTRAQTVIFSITGGAQNLRLAQDKELTLNKELTLMEGLVSAAQVSGAAIISAGTDAGLAQLLGRAIKETRHIDVPLIGIAPFGGVLGHDALRRGLQVSSQKSSAMLKQGGDPAIGGSVWYDHVGNENTHDGAALEPHHSHLILVDDGSRGSEAWGTEI